MDSEMLPVPVQNAQPEMVLDPQQVEAVELCIDKSNRLVGVTGMAGSGKTTIMRQCYDALISAGYTGVLCAPTGKAAKRIQEATGIQAMTVHRLLEFNRPEFDQKTGKATTISGPSRRKENPLEQDFVLCDEYMMVHTELDRQLKNAIPAGGFMRVFGDANQLPPIEPGWNQDRNVPAPFEDVLNKFKSVRLLKNHRQGAGSGIAENGRRILSGMCPQRNDETQITITTDYIATLMKQIEVSGVDFGKIENQIITPMKNKALGTRKINAQLQPLFHESMSGAQSIPRTEWEKEYPLHLLTGDKVIYEENDYELEVFNGETGIVTDMTEFGEVIVDFGDRVVVVPPIIETTNKKGEVALYDPRKKLHLAYALTTHKAQGSEYKHGIYMMTRGGFILQTRSNFYTGLTRFREGVHIISDIQSYQRAPQMVKAPVWKKKGA